VGGLENLKQQVKTQQQSFSDKEQPYGLPTQKPWVS
jgi:hypothetical protein